MRFVEGDPLDVCFLVLCWSPVAVCACVFVKVFGAAGMGISRYKRGLESLTFMLAELLWTTRGCVLLSLVIQSIITRMRL